jgi:hypothetical protein
MSRRSLLLMVMLCLGCRDATEIVVEEPPPAVSTDFARLQEVLAGVQKAGQVLLYEGLPSEFWEPQLRAQELAQKETLDVHGYPVYEEQLTLSDTDAEQLTSLFSARESYLPFDKVSRKKCGGFTAEYCAEWTTGETKTQLLICLECGEVMLFGPQSELHCNLSPDAAQRLKQLLSPYQKNPPSEKPNS